MQGKSSPLWHMAILVTQNGPELFVENIFSPLILTSLLKISWPQTHEFISGISILSHWSMGLPLLLCGKFSNWEVQSSKSIFVFQNGFGYSGLMQFHIDFWINLHEVLQRSQLVRVGNTCILMADSCWCTAKPIQYCKVINLQLK